MHKGPSSSRRLLGIATVALLQACGSSDTRDNTREGAGQPPSGGSCPPDHVTLAGWQVVGSTLGGIRLTVPPSAKHEESMDDAGADSEDWFSEGLRISVVEPRRPTYVDRSSGWDVDCTEMLDGHDFRVRLAYNPPAIRPGLYMQAYSDLKNGRRLIVGGYARDSTAKDTLLAVYEACGSSDRTRGARAAPTIPNSRPPSLVLAPGLRRARRLWVIDV
jgi:hypothetical protein